MKKLLPYLGKYKKYAILTPIMVLFEAGLDILLPFFLAKIIDEGIAKNDFNYVVKIGVIMLTLSSISMVLAVFAGKFAAIAGVGFAKNLRMAIFRKIQDFSFSNSDKFNTATLMTRMTNDVTNTSGALMASIRILVRAPVMLIFATLIAVNTSTQLAAVFFISLPILAVALGLILKYAHPRFVAMLVWYDKLSETIQETLMSIREVKGFVREKHEEKKFLSVSGKLKSMSLDAEKVTILDGPIMQITLYICTAAILYMGGKLVIGEQMKTGQLVSFIQYLFQALNALMMISFAMIQIVISRASVVRINEVLEEKIDIDPNTISELMLNDGSIEFKNIDFRYGKESKHLIFNNLNLKIKSGETIGIIGATGTGKSTLVQLVPRLYDVTSGEVIVGGNNVKDYNLETLRDSVAMVLQKNILFSGTILENLRWGSETATLQEVEEAAKVAQSHDFILNQPDGYNTYLEQGGTNLSGGQKQRLCIARALLKNPKIIILDDSTSAVDTDTDKKIRNAFNNELKETTAIIIAQRISSVDSADRIIVLDDTGINAVGTHDELLKSNEIYSEIYKIQKREVLEIEE